jgi:hypothetical protein
MVRGMKLAHLQKIMNEQYGFQASLVFYNNHNEQCMCSNCAQGTRVQAKVQGVAMV